MASDFHLASSSGRHVDSWDYWDLHPKAGQRSDPWWGLNKQGVWVTGEERGLLPSPGGWFLAAVVQEASWQVHSLWGGSWGRELRILAPLGPAHRALQRLEGLSRLNWRKTRSRIL